MPTAVAGAKARVLHTSAYPVPDIAEHELPRYSVLVPLCREQVVLPMLITQLAALYYPAESLQRDALQGEGCERVFVEAVHHVWWTPGHANHGPC